MSRIALGSLDEERRKKRATHVEGRGNNNMRAQPQSNWGRIEQLTNRIENGGTSAGGGSGAAAMGGGEGGGGAMPMLDASEETAFTPPADQAQNPQDAQNQGGMKIWSTFQMFDDERMKHERDVADLLQRLREEAVKDHQKVADFLREHPDLASMLIKAVPDPAALNGWGAPGGDGGSSGPMSDGAGGFFV